MGILIPSSMILPIVCLLGFCYLAVIIAVAWLAKKEGSRFGSLCF
jgi:hypothetical protein